MVGPTESLIALFKNVASTEPNTEMQSTIFAMAAKYQSFSNYLDTYAQCEEQTAMIIDEAKLYVVTPVRVLRYSLMHLIVTLCN